MICLLMVIAYFTNTIRCHQNHHQQQPFAQQQQHQQPPAHGQNGPGVHHDPMSEHINKDHVLEHLDGVINKPKEKMSQDEQNFYYFKLHDYDNNNMLDGLELVSAFAHNENGKKKSSTFNRILIDRNEPCLSRLN